MKFKSIVMALFVCISLFAYSVSSNSDTEKKSRIPRLRTMSQILKKAECPLTETQIEQIKEIERGPGFREELFSILGENQIEALGNARKIKGRNVKGFQGLRMISLILKKAECPLTETQIEQIKGIERGPGFREELFSILGENQKVALENARKVKGRNVKGFQGLKMISLILKKAECPLTETQIEQIKEIERGPGFREELFSILGENQIEALENARKVKGRINKNFRVRKMAGILKNAGCALSEDQLQQLRNIKPDPAMKEQFKAILTQEQQTALETFFNNYSIDESQEPTGVEELSEPFNVIIQNYPNPFNPTTTIEYQIVEPGNVTVEVYNSNGQLIKTLVNEYQNAGPHSVVWDASSLAAGIYLYRITSGNVSRMKKMTLVK